MIEPMLDNINVTATMTRGVIIAIGDNGLVEVQVNPKQDNLFCRILMQGEQHPSWLTPGVEVLISNIPSDSDDGVVLGRIGGYQASETATRTIEAKQIIIEAGDELEVDLATGTIKVSGGIDSLLAFRSYLIRP